MEPSEEDVYCTLLMNDGYLPGAAVLAHSLRDCGSTKKLACLVTPDTLRPSTLNELRSLYNYVISVEPIANPNPHNLYLMNRADLLFTFTKIQLWRQTQFRKIVYVDADVVALRAPEELFDLPDTFAAAPDVGWPDAFNSGVMVITPHEGDYRALRNMAVAGDSFDGADQGLLNQYYEHKPWKRLSFTYNCTPSGSYQYEPAYRYYKRDISMVHFIGSSKPWQQERHAGTHAYQELLSRWWSVYDRHITQTPFEYVAGSSKAPISSLQSTGIIEPRHSWAVGGHAEGTKLPAPPPEAPSSFTELPLTEDRDQNDSTHMTGLAAAQERQPFSAPHMEWDATRAAPPVESKPEAANFPSQVYEFNADRNLFHPPARYPEPPKNMWYEVPADRPKIQKPAPIFPWEEREVPKPTRRFVDDEQDLQPTALPEAELVMEVDEFEVNDNTPGASTPTITVSDASWHAFGSINKNAWDEVSGIEDYVRALTSRQKNRGKVQIVHSAEPRLTDEILEGLTDKVNERRESLILTDFPSAIERPSLPVTPAPRRRTTFWGEDREDEELPVAEGVPSQADWNPAEQLERLRRNSLIGPANLKLISPRQIPDRGAISSAAPIPEDILDQHIAKPVDDSVQSPRGTSIKA